jgi:hypothetical protein
MGHASTRAIALAAMLALFAPAAARAAPPPNDDFADAVELSGDSPEASGTTEGATAEAGEPDRLGDLAGTSVWYRWTPTRSGLVTVACQSNFDTILTVFRGQALNGLTEIGSDHSGSLCGPPDLAFRASAGVEYRIAVDAAEGGGGGGFILELANTSTAPSNDDFAAAQSLQTHTGQGTSGSTAGAGREPGEPPHGGSANGSSVWFSWVATRSGLTRVYPCDASYHPLIDVYTGSSLTALDRVSTPADISGEFPWCGLGGLGGATFPAVAGTTYRIAVDGSGGEWGFFRIELQEAPPPDLTPPTTQLSGFYIHRRTARFEFEGSDAPTFLPLPGQPFPEPAATRLFLCRLDRHPFVRCRSPKRYGGLSTGPHRFEVRAVDEAGNEDPTAVGRRFRILKPGSRP